MNPKYSGLVNMVDEAMAGIEAMVQSPIAAKILTEDEYKEQLHIKATAQYEDYPSFSDIALNLSEKEQSIVSAFMKAALPDAHKDMKPRPRQAFPAPKFTYMHRLQVRRWEHYYAGAWGWTSWKDVDVWYTDTTFKKSKRRGEAACRRYQRMRVKLTKNGVPINCEWRVVPYKPRQA